MFPNLNAEQSRYSESNAEVAKMLGVTRSCYEAKKKRGKFSIREVNLLCDHYRCKYNYLFSEAPIGPEELFKESAS